MEKGAKSKLYSEFLGDGLILRENARGVLGNQNLTDAHSVFLALQNHCRNYQRSSGNKFKRAKVQKSSQTIAS